MNRNPKPPPPGKGRIKGSKNAATKAREEMIAKEGVTPLEYMLGILRNTAATAGDRRWAAQAAAPYVHPRLSQVDAHHSGAIDVRAWLQSLGEPDDKL